MRIEHQPNVPALRRDWIAAQVVATAGGTLILAVAVLAVAGALTASPPPTARVVLPMTPARDAAAERAESAAICDAALAAAQGLGVVPGFARRDGDETKPGGAVGRYRCAAKTDAARYTITFDLACKRLGPGCIVPVAVDQDGTRIYRRG